MYSPEELPYHVIVPSLPGFAFSTGPPLDAEWTCEDTAHIMDKLMVGLGFGAGYVAHGGDIGSMVARVMAATCDSCKGNLMLRLIKTERMLTDFLQQCMVGLSAEL